MLAITIAACSFDAGLARAQYHPPLDSQVDLSSAPSDLVRSRADGGPPVTERIRVKQFLYQEIKNTAGKDIGAKMTLDLQVAQLFELEIPGLENVMSVAFGTGPFHAEVVMREEHADNPAEDYPFILTLVPGDKQVAIRFKNDVLKPVQPTTYQPYTSSPPIPELALSAGIKVQVTYSWEGEASVSLVDAGGLRPKLSLNTPVAIGDSGMVLEVQDAEIDLSRENSPPGFPAQWQGILFKKLALNFVNGLDVPRVEHGEGAAPLPPTMAGVTLTDFSVGSGGISGGICGNLSTGPTLSLFGSSFRLDRLCVTLREGSLTAGEVAGTLLEFPFFKNPVKLTLALSLNGDFKVGLSPPNPGAPTTAIDLTVPGVLVFHLEALSIERKQSLYIWKLSGKMNIIEISTAPQDAIAVNGLSITSQGDVAIDGGWLTLPGKKTIDFKGFAVELAELGFGTEQPGTPQAKQWVGFSGGIQLSKGFDAAARFKKLQFLWPGDSGPVDVRLSGVEVSFKKPGVLSFTGALDYFKDPLTGDGFAGKVECNIEALKLSVAGRLVIGKATPATGPPFPFFYIDLAAQLPTGIPLFSNVSLYGLLGQFAFNMEPNIRAFTSPVQWFEAHRIATNVLAGSPPPWKARDGAFAIGAGAIIGTTSDDGFVTNAKLAVMVALPGPVIMLQGAANIVKKRGDLTGSEKPNFVCLAIFDGNANTFLLNIGAYYSIKNVLEVQGEAEVYFNLDNPNDWHLWIGKDQPEERRVRAEVLSFLKASTYFMIDPGSFKHGSKAGYDKTWKFGPLRVHVEALFAYDLALFWRPAHVWGKVQLKGGVELKAFGIGVGLAAHAILEAATPKPFFVDGELHVKLSLPWPLPDPEATVHLRWEEQQPKEPLDELVSGLVVEPRKRGYAIRPETVSLSGSSARSAPLASVPASSLCSPGDSVPADGQTEARCQRPLVPLDVMMVAGFQRDANDVNNLGFGNTFNAASPRLDTIDQTRFQYDLDGYELVQAHKGGGTLTFDTPLTDLYGAWPALAGGAQPSALFLKILSRNPLEGYQDSKYLFYDNDTKGWTEWAVGTYGFSFCKDVGKAKKDRSWGNAVIGVKRCELPLDLLLREDFILPPYSAFRLTVDSDVTRNDSGPDRMYRNTAVFHTEGPPLDLAPYVDVNIPADDRRPHYRGYDVGVRFNDTYLDLMYREEGQQFQVQILDDNDRPLRAVDSDVFIHTQWDQAAGHVPRPTEDDWLQFLRGAGVPVDTVAPKDDRVFGRVSLPDAIRAGERHRVRFWLEDARLAGDQRLGDARWTAAHPIRHRTGNRVVLYEFTMLASRYRDFREHIGSYPGNYVEETVATTANRGAIATAAARVGPPVSAYPSTLSNPNGVELGRFLRHALSPRSPDAVTAEEQETWIRRAPGYAGKPERMTDGERQSMIASWNDSLSAFEQIEKEMGLETVRRPLPKQLELRILRQNGETIGLLVESPEAIDVTRLALTLRPIPGSNETPLVVPNRDNTRVFVMRPSGGTLLTWPDATYLLQFTYFRTVGSRYPAMRTTDSADREVVTIVLDLPGDRFVPPSP